MKSITFRGWVLPLLLGAAMYVLINSLSTLVLLAIHNEPIDAKVFADDFLPLVGAIMIFVAVFAGVVQEITSGEVIGRECYDVREGNSSEVVRTQYVFRLKDASSGRTGEKFVTEEEYDQYRIGDHYGATK